MEREVVLQNVELPTRALETLPSNSETEVAVLPQPAPQTATPHQVNLPLITSGQAKTKLREHEKVVSTATSTMYRHKRQLLEDGSGKRNKRTKVYSCGKCDKPKCKDTGHRQLRGRWWCPSDNITYEEWKLSLLKK